jgi:hypothetical protein
MNTLLLSLLFVLFFSFSGTSQCCYTSPNLLKNSDFSAPYVNGIPPHFTSDAVYSPFHGAGTYDVVSSRNYGACVSTPQFDHTTGDSSGWYLWYDTPYHASPSNPGLAWMPFDKARPDTAPFAADNKRRVDVQKNTWYSFSCWIRDIARESDCVNGGAPVMGLRINGVDMHQIDLGQFTTPCCPKWIYLCTEWYSGSDTTAALIIESRNANGFTDLAIDDVYFGLKDDPLLKPLSIEDTTCEGRTITLGARLQQHCPGCTFVWKDDTTSSSVLSTDSSFIVQNLTTNRTFYVQVQNASKCSSHWASVNVTVLPLGDPRCATVPLELISFTGKRSGQLTTLRWMMYKQDEASVVLERSCRGSAFVPIYQSLEEHTDLHYSYEDVHACKGPCYYRLKLREPDGRNYYSAVLSIYASQAAAAKLSVNPVRRDAPITVEYPFDTNAETRILLVNTQGDEVYAFEGFLPPGSTRAEIPSVGLPLGLYYLLMRNGGESSSFKVWIKE